MSLKLQEIIDKARQLSPLEQLDLIRELSESLQIQYLEVTQQPQHAGGDTIPSSIRRTKPASDLADYAADFWLKDESVDELNAYIQ